MVVSGEVVGGREGQEYGQDYGNGSACARSADTTGSFAGDAIYMANSIRRSLPVRCGGMLGAERCAMYSRAQQRNEASYYWTPTGIEEINECSSRRVCR